jgi:hypothetical protein
VGIVKWIEKMEFVIRISDYKDDCIVKYATCSFQDKALTWWNSEVQTRGWEAIDLMTWGELKIILLKKFYPRNEVQKLEAEFLNLEMKGADVLAYNNRFGELARLVPHMVTPESKRIQRYIWGLVPQIRGMVTSANPTTMQSALKLTGRLTDEMVRSRTLGKVQVGEKKKLDNRNFRGNNNNAFKKPAPVVRNYAAVAPPESAGGGKGQRCPECTTYRRGDCPSCFKSKKSGHIAKFCRE